MSPGAEPSRLGGWREYPGGLFRLLTFLLLWQSVQPKPRLVLVDILMLSCATEFLQLFVERRGALPLDVVIDTVGSATSLLIRK